MGQCVVANINYHASIDRVPFKLTGLKWKISYNHKIAITHSAPLGVNNNFVMDPKYPRYYAGFQGRIWLRYDKQPSFGSWHIFDNTVTYTGTGGAGNYDGPFKRSETEYPCSYYYNFYLLDWPMIFSNEIFMANLMNEEFNMDHEFYWDENLGKDKCEICHGE